MTKEDMIVMMNQRFEHLIEKESIIKQKDEQINNLIHQLAEKDKQINKLIDKLLTPDVKSEEKTEMKGEGTYGPF